MSLGVSLASSARTRSSTSVTYDRSAPRIGAIAANVDDGHVHLRGRAGDPLYGAAVLVLLWNLGRRAAVARMGSSLLEDPLAIEVAGLPVRLRGRLAGCPVACGPGGYVR